MYITVSLVDRLIMCIDVSFKLDKNNVKFIIDNITHKKSMI